MILFGWVDRAICKCTYVSHARKSCEIYALRSWESLTFPKWARKYSKSIEIQNKQKNKVQNWKCINKAKMEMLIERDLLLLITLRRRRKPRVWARQVYWESTIPLTATSVSLNWFSGLCIVTLLLLFGLFQKQSPRGAPRKRYTANLQENTHA